MGMMLFSRRESRRFGSLEIKSCSSSPDFNLGRASPVGFRAIFNDMDALAVTQDR